MNFVAVLIFLIICSKSLITKLHNTLLSYLTVVRPYWKHKGGKPCPLPATLHWRPWTTGPSCASQQTKWGHRGSPASSTSSWQVMVVSFLLIMAVIVGSLISIMTGSGSLLPFNHGRKWSSSFFQSWQVVILSFLSFMAFVLFFPSF